MTISVIFAATFFAVFFGYIYVARMITPPAPTDQDITATIPQR